MQTQSNIRLKSLRKVEISGKPYTMVDARIMHSAANFNYKVKIKKVKYYDSIKTWTTEVRLSIKWEGDEFWSCYDGIAQEVIGAGFINKTSALENCYTSALGKAFTAAGIGIEHGSASGDEMIKALDNQKRLDTHFNSILEHCEELKEKYPDWTVFLERAEKVHRLSNDQKTQLSKIWLPKTSA